MNDYKSQQVIKKQNMLNAVYLYMTSTYKANHSMHGSASSGKDGFRFKGKAPNFDSSHKQNPLTDQNETWHDW